MRQIGVGVIGCGAISRTYMNNMTNTYSVLKIVGCSDLISERSARRAAEFGTTQMTNEEIFNHPDIDIVVNLTYPLSHYEVTKAALLHGKNVQSEKMMATNFEEATELYNLAKEKGLRLGMAPDTFLGGGYQTCRKIIDSGLIGEPVSAQALVARSYDLSGTNPENTSMVLNRGGTIPFDMGGYYIHAMTSLLGPVKRVAGFAKRETRTYKNVQNPNFGKTIEIDAPTRITGSLEFASGVYGSITCISESFGETPRLEIYGTKGTLICPDPNGFGGPVYIITKTGTKAWQVNYKDDSWYEFPLTHGFSDGCRRGLGVADMAWAIINNRPHRCADIGYHAIEIVTGIFKSCETGEVYEMTSTMERPAPLPSGYPEGPTGETALAL